MSLHRTDAPSVRDIARHHWNLLVGLTLRDIQTRFGSAYGFIIAIVWPLSHILLLVTIYAYTGRMAPYGDSNVLWFSVSVTPFMIVSYTSRFMVIGVLQNRPLLALPAVSLVSVLLSRVVIEGLIALCVVIALIIVMAIIGVDFIPANGGYAASALGLSFMLGVGIGFLNASMALLVRQWTTAMVLTMLFLWATSGILFVPSMLDERLQYFLYFHPIIHCVELARTAWFENYNSRILDIKYLTAVISATLFLGLTLERLIRGRMLYQ